MTPTFLSATFHTYVTIYKYLYHLHIKLLSLYWLDMQGHALRKMSKTRQVNDEQADKTRQSTVSIECHHFVSSICRYMDQDFVQSLVECHTKIFYFLQYIDIKVVRISSQDIHIKKSKVIKWIRFTSSLNLIVKNNVVNIRI